MSKINKIKLSGTTYDIQDLSATSVVNVTQAEYDALVTGGTVDPTVLYNITDAQAGDLSQYWTSAQTNSAITEAVSGKQDTLISGTNIKTINNESILGNGNIDIQGGGVDVDSAFNASSTNPVANSAITRNLTDGSGDIINSGGRYQWGFYSVGGYSTNKGFYLDIINGEPVVRKYSNTRSLQLVETSAITTSISSSSTDAQIPSAKAVYDQLGGLKLVKLSQSEYDALAAKDSNTLYIVTDS